MQLPRRLLLLLALVLLPLLLSRVGALQFRPDIVGMELTSYSGEVSYDKSLITNTAGTQVYTFDLKPVPTMGDTLMGWPLSGSQAPSRGSSRCSTITLVFKEMQIRSAMLNIIDTGKIPETPFYTCNSCQLGDRIVDGSSQTSYMPPPFNSSTGAVRIVVSSSASTSGVSKFTIQYSCNVMYVDKHESKSSPSVFMAMGYGTVRPFLSTQVQPKGDGTYSYAAKLQPFDTQTFNILSPVRWHWNSATQAWDRTSVKSTIILAVTLIRWSPAFCTSNEVTLHVYDSATLSNKVYDACSATTKKWLTSTDDGYAVVQLKNSNKTASKELYFEVSWYTDSDLWECGEMRQPDRLIADSWLLSDGSQGFSSPHSGGLQRNIIVPKFCQWLLSPFSTASVAPTLTLIFQWVSLKPGSQVVVYDGNSTSSPLLWDSGSTFFARKTQGLSFITPPPLISSGPTLYVLYSTDPQGDSKFFGFAGEYASNTISSIGFGDGTATMSMNSAVDISPPGDGSRYLPGMKYTWLISPRAVINYADVDGGPISFSVGALNLPKGDSLIVYNSATPSDQSKIIANLTGSVAPRNFFTTSSNVASMVFRSSSSSSGIGTVRISYFTDGPNYHCGFTRNPAVLTSASMVFTDGSYSKEALYNNQHCQWSLAPVGAVGIFLSFNRFELFGGALNIYDGPVSTGTLIATIGETAAVPAPILLYSSSGVLGIDYSTGASASGRGFNATYFGVSPSQVSLPGDQVIRIYSSSMQSLQHITYKNALYVNETIVYVIRPASSLGNRSAGHIFFSVTSLNMSIPSCKQSVLEIYDGDRSLPNTTFDNSSYSGNGLLARLCGSQVPRKWIKTRFPVATLRLRTFANDSHHWANQSRASFSLAYFSDAPSSHCGFNANPGLLTPASMVFTDGSASYEQLYPGQNCELIISPQQAKGGLLVLEFLQSDLRGAQLSVFEGNNPDVSKLLWQCLDCSIVPRPLITSLGSMFLRFTSDSATISPIRGSGFKAVYWSLNGTAAASANSALTQAAGAVLEMPLGMGMSMATANTSLSWRLGLASTIRSQLSVYPRYTYQSLTNFTNQAFDGRPGNSSLDSLLGSAPMCGFISAVIVSSVAGAPPAPSPPLVNVLQTLNNSIYMTASQRATYVASGGPSNKLLYDAKGSYDTSLPAGPSSDANAALFHASDTCKYTIDSGNSQSVTLTIVSFSGAGGARLRVLGGVHGIDQVLFDSAVSGPAASGVSFVAWCGLATILLDSGAAVSGTLGAGPPPAHSLQLTYELNTMDSGLDCVNYKLSLLPKIIKPDPLIPLYIALGALGACCFSFVGFYHLRRYLRKHWPQGGFAALLLPRVKRYQVVTPRHLRYTPRLDELRNRLLRPGKCCVCQDEKLPVFRLGCHHALCREDLLGYLNSALGDISMFPVKCPMHYEGCAGMIDARMSKRVLSKPLFDKFNEFSDRATYGEGMRCIFCVNFVNFPLEGTVSMVECPYCIQRFCMRCKKSWHFGSRCPLDKVDDTLDEWRKESAAQRCPCCHKLIEKDDPSTCNHMVHKVTDGIPCLRDRTDFCYMCGEEVTPDYPHEEVRNPGINHFPDGVFQTCRKVAQREREAERERIKRLRRMKVRKNGDRSVQQFGFGVMGTDENNPEYEEHNWSDEEGGGEGNVVQGRPMNDAFDAQWDLTLGPGGADRLRGSAGHRVSPIAPAPHQSPSQSPTIRRPSASVSATPGRPASNQGSRVQHTPGRSRVSPNG